MFITARQLEEMYKAHGRIVLPYRTRLTPAAQDWSRLKKVQVGYGDDDLSKACVTCCDGGKPRANGAHAAGDKQTLPWLWWCDGPCAAAKAAVAGMSREANLTALDIADDPKRIVEVVKKLAGEVKADRAAGGVLAVTTAGEALVYANRCPSLRAIAGTTMAAVETGVRDVAANVLVVEHPRATLMQTKNILARFLRGPRELSEDLRQRLKDLATCE
jgi:hypothetical protein